MKRLVAVVVTAVLSVSLASLASLGGASAAPSAGSSAATYAAALPGFAACADRPSDQCGQFAVPLDYANPGGEKISLAVRIRPHTSATYQGIMLANPGGPGASGTGLVGLAGAIPNHVGEQYDWVGFDPRGVGESIPALSCNTHYFGVNRPSFVPRTHKLMRFWKKKTAGYARDCGTSAAARLLPHMSTLDSVQDMEALRSALIGDGPMAKLNFYGFSYGTYLGQVYANRYPERVGRFVLDGVVNPTDYWYGANLKQEIGFDRNLNIFFRWMAKHPGAYHLGTSGKAIRRGYNALVKRLDRHPAYHRKLGPDELADAMINAGYYVYDWDAIAAAYSKLVRTGQGRGIFKIYAGSNMGNDNGYAVYLGVQCSDVLRPPWSTQVHDAWRIHRKRPFLAWDNTWFNAPCRTWRAPSRTLVPVSGAAAAADGGKFLLVNETKDAATPYSGALKVRSLFPSSALIAGVGGTTHAGSLSGVTCVDSRISTFLASGTLPARQAGGGADVDCPKVPPPPATRYARTAGGAGMSAALRDLLVRAQRFG
ncbi:pimeloyl-ACP methyl ester carboxylesterase [Marmoricola sp. URHA0025 HA25]